jgi:hypothetical protein
MALCRFYARISLCNYVSADVWIIKFGRAARQSCSFNLGLGNRLNNCLKTNETKKRKSSGNIPTRCIGNSLAFDNAELAVSQCYRKRCNRCVPPRISCLLMFRETIAPDWENESLITLLVSNAVTA